MEFTIGSIGLFPYNFVMMDWLLCDGSLVSISQYQVLFAVIGTRYGGDGVTNFALPNLSGAKPHDSIRYFIAYNGIFPTRD